MLILEAWSKEDVIKNLGADVQKFIDKNKLKDSVSDLVDKSMKIDPSTDKKYVGSIVRWLIQKRPEDLEAQIKPLLTDFHKLLEINSGKFGNAAKQIIKGKMNLDELSKLVKANSDLLGNPDANIKLVDALKNFKKVGGIQDTKFYVYVIDRWIPAEGTGDKETGPKHICFTGNVDWCVKYKEMFDKYGIPFYLFVDHQFNPIYLYHQKSGQFKDVHGVAVENSKQLDEIFPIIKNIGLPKTHYCDLGRYLYLKKQNRSFEELKEMAKRGSDAQTVFKFITDFCLFFDDLDYIDIEDAKELFVELLKNYKLDDLKPLFKYGTDLFELFRFFTDTPEEIKMISGISNFIPVFNAASVNQDETAVLFYWFNVFCNTAEKNAKLESMNVLKKMIPLNKKFSSSLRDIIDDMEDDRPSKLKKQYAHPFHLMVGISKDDLKFLKSLVQPTVTESIYAKSNWLLG